MHWDRRHHRLRPTGLKSYTYSCISDRSNTSMSPVTRPISSIVSQSHRCNSTTTFCVSMLTVEQYNGTTTQANSAHRITAELSHLHHNTATVIVFLRPSARALLSYSKGRFKIVHYALVAAASVVAASRHRGHSLALLSHGTCTHVEARQ